MNNDKELAWRVSYTQSILKTNHVEVDTSSGSYRLIVEEERIVEESQGLTEAREICIKNPYQLRIRFDRILSEVLGLSRTEVKLKYDNGDIIMRVDNDSKDNCRTKKETIMNTFNINKAYVCKQAVFEVNDKLI